MALRALHDRRGGARHGRDGRHAREGGRHSDEGEHGAECARSELDSHKMNVALFVVVKFGPCCHYTPGAPLRKRGVKKMGEDLALEALRNCPRARGGLVGKQKYRVLEPFTNQNPENFARCARQEHP